MTCMLTISAWPTHRRLAYRCSSATSSSSMTSCLRCRPGQTVVAGGSARWRAVAVLSGRRHDLHMKPTALILALVLTGCTADDVPDEEEWLDSPEGVSAAIPAHDPERCPGADPNPI